MSSNKPNACPLLKSIVCPLDQCDYDKVIGVSRLQTKEQKLVQEQAVKDAIDKEHQRTDSLVDRQSQQISKLQDTVKHLKQGTTPQSVGYADEASLTAELVAQFPDDDIQHKGKKGDVLQIVMAGNVAAGCLIYECKRTQSLTKSHVRQAYEAKGLRQADFAILVTTGKRKDFGGFAEMDGVYVVAPSGVLSLAALLRRSLIELKQSNLTGDEKARVLSNLRTYITEGEFKQAMDDIVQRSAMLDSQIHAEIEAHLHAWRERVDHYNHINYSASLVQCNVTSLLLGGVPRKITCPPTQVPPFLLEGSTK